MGGAQVCLFLLLVPSAAPSVSSDQQGEAELVAMVRGMVAERFSSNPAYQLLKARFLSCFTVPALLATVQPITEKPVACQASEEDEEEEEEQLRKMKERGKQRRAEVSPEFIKGTFLFFIIAVMFPVTSRICSTTTSHQVSSLKISPC